MVMVKLSLRRLIGLLSRAMQFARMKSAGSVEASCWQPPSGLTARTGLADCGVGALWLHEQCVLRQLPAQRRYGLFLSVPISFPHSWTEVLIEGTWTPFDPLLLKLLHEHARLDAERWPVTRSLGSVVMALSNAERGFVTAQGHSIEVSYLTKFVPVEGL